MKENKEWVAKH